MTAARWIVVVLIAFTPAALRAQPDGAGDAGADFPGAVDAEAEIEAPFALRVNHVAKDDVIIVLKGDEVYIDRADLRAAGITLTGGEDAVVAGRKLLRLSSVSPPLRYELDEEQVELTITAPPELLPHTRIDLSARPPDLVYSREPSAFFNYAPSITDDGRATMYEEMGLSIDGNLLFSSAYLSTERSPVRGVTHLIVDDRPNLIRWTFGDALVSSGALGSGGFVGGVTVSRTYELDPYAIKTPRIGLRGSTPTPATLDVLVNGSRVHTQELEPGTFELDNLQVGGGAGVVSYVLRDVFGKEQEIATPFYMSSEALNPGIDEYTYSLGVLREAVSTESFAYDVPVLFAQHRRGLDTRLTVGGRAEATPTRISAGPSLTALAGIGQIDLDLGASYDGDATFGAAAQVAYSYISRIFGCSLFLRGTSDHYANVGLTAQDDRTTLEGGALLNVPVGGRLTVSYGSSVGTARDGGVSANFDASTSVRITDALSWNTNALRRVQEHSFDEWQVTTTLNFAFAHGYGAQAGMHVERGKPRARLSTVKSLPAGTGLGYRAAATLGEDYLGEGQIQYQTLFGRYGLRYLGRNSDSSLTLDAAGAIVAVPGVGVFPTLPVQSGFGVIRVPGVAGVRGYGNHQELGETDRNGNLVVPNLVNYYGNHLAIAPEDVPLEYELERTEAVLAPPPRGVAIAEFRTEMSHFFRGRITIQDGDARVVPKYGQVTIEQDGEQVVSPLGDEGEFELSDLKFGTHSALIEWEGGTCVLDIVLDPTEETVIDMGELLCRREPAAR